MKLLYAPEDYNEPFSANSGDADLCQKPACHGRRFAQNSERDHSSLIPLRVYIRRGAVKGSEFSRLGVPEKRGQVHTA
jgi:hypothetical protein